MRKSDEVIDALSRLDPIDGERVAAAWSASDDRSVLFEEITTMPTAIDATDRHVRPADVPATTRRPPRPRVRRLVGAVALAAVAILGVQTFVLDPAPAFTVVEGPDGVIQVRVLPEFRDGEALARSLRDHGVQAEVRTVVSSPSMVGTVELFGDPEAAGPPPGLTFGAETPDDVFDWTIDPAVFTGSLTVVVHVAARNGEEYASAQEVFEPGEVLAGLHCADGLPLRATSVARRLDDLGLTGVWSVVTPTDDPSVTDSVVVDEVPDGEILSGFPVDERTVRFEVVLDGVDSSAMARWISDVPCTPAQAAPWK